MEQNLEERVRERERERVAADLTGEVCERGRVVGTKERERENEENMSLYILYDSLCERVIESVIDRERERVRV